MSCKYVAFWYMYTHSTPWSAGLPFCRVRQSPLLVKVTKRPMTGIFSTYRSIPFPSAVLENFEL